MALERLTTTVYVIEGRRFREFARKYREHVDVPAGFWKTEEKNAGEWARGSSPEKLIEDLLHVGKSISAGTDDNVEAYLSVTVVRGCYNATVFGTTPIGTFAKWNAETGRVKAEVHSPTAALPLAADPRIWRGRRHPSYWAPPPSGGPGFYQTRKLYGTVHS